MFVELSNDWTRRSISLLFGHSIDKSRENWQKLWFDLQTRK